MKHAGAGMFRLAVLLFAGVVAAASAQERKPRVVITADPELDDNNTLIRAILYSSDMQIEGLIYTSSTFHWKGDGKGTTQYLPEREYTRMGACPCESWRWAADEHFIDDIVDAYAKVYGNLKVHKANYPRPAELKAKIKWGNVAFEGDYSQDTDGSNLIKGLLLDDQPGPLYVTAQGGQSTIARALKSIHDQYANTAQWEAVRDKVSVKLIVLPSGDQDGAYARYIKPNWPEVAERPLSGMDFGYFVRMGLRPQDQMYVSTAWTRENVSSRGLLGALYRVWGDGKQMVKGDRTDFFGLSGVTADQLKSMGYMVWMPPQEKGSFIGEGDTPTFLNFVDNGLRAYEDQRWSGWGGAVRSSHVSTLGLGRGPIAPAGPDDPGMALGLAAAGSSANKNDQPVAAAGALGTSGGAELPPLPAENAAANARFFVAAQNDFAARLQWSVTPNLRDANHEPEVWIKGPVDISGTPGSEVRLIGKVSDRDHNAVKVLWWQDRLAGSYAGDIQFADESALRTTFRVPKDAKPGDTIHVILEATDDGAPPLTRYRRVVVRVQ